MPDAFFFSFFFLFQLEMYFLSGKPAATYKTTLEAFSQQNMPTHCSERQTVLVDRSIFIFTCHLQLY